MTGRPHIITFHTINNCGYAWDEKQKKWISLIVEDHLRDQNTFGFQNTDRPKGIFIQPVDDDDEYEAQFGEDDSHDPLNKDASPTPSMNAFRMEMRDAFEQLQVTQDIPLRAVGRARGVLSPICRRATVMLARLCNRFLPDQCSSGGSDADIAAPWGSFSFSVLRNFIVLYVSFLFYAF